jgi:F0F1-type ATP synthase membrane subunit b/b'
MSIEEVEYMLTLLGSFGLGAVIFGVIVFLFVKSYLATYLDEKAKNLAKIEDIEGITRKIEDVKHEYMAQVQGLTHQNNLILEQARGQQKLRLAALDKRLQAHQEAYALWREMIRSIHTEENTATVMKCQEWYNNNCLYLDANSRDAFQIAYSAMGDHPTLLSARLSAVKIKDNFSRITVAGEIIVSSAELPPLGERESELLTEGEEPNKLCKKTPQSGAPS